MHTISMQSQNPINKPGSKVPGLGAPAWTCFYKKCRKNFALEIVMKQRKAGFVWQAPNNRKEPGISGSFILPQMRLSVPHPVHDKPDGGFNLSLFIPGSVQPEDKLQNKCAAD